MFCNKCGKQNEDNTNFCTGCGASLDTDSATSVTTAANDERNLPMIFAGALVMQLLVIVLWFCKCIEYSEFYVIKVGQSMHEFFYYSSEGNSILSVISVVVGVIGLIAIAYPLITGTVFAKRRRMTIAGLSAAWFTFFYAIMLLSLHLNSSEVRSNLTLGGILYLLADIALVVLLQIISFRTKKYKKQK